VPYLSFPCALQLLARHRQLGAIVRLSADQLASQGGLPMEKAVKIEAFFAREFDANQVKQLQF
jgi:hypothetical protein